MEGDEDRHNLIKTEEGEDSHSQLANISLHGASSIFKTKLTKTLRLSLEDIAEEWAQVPRPGNVEQSGKVRTLEVSVDEAFCHLRSLDLPNADWSSHGGADRLRWTELLHWLRAPPKLDAALKSEYDLVLAITQCGLDWSDSVHWRMLQTVYKRMTGREDDCPQYGPHWMEIGFQGRDPSTDLRGVGLLGLVHLLHLATGTRRPLAVRLLAVSRSRDQPFPLAVLSLNVSAIAVQALRASRLNKECNLMHSVFDVVNQFYTVIINYIYNVWTEEKKTLKDSGVLLKGHTKANLIPYHPASFPPNPLNILFLICKRSEHTYLQLTSKLVDASSPSASAAINVYGEHQSTCEYAERYCNRHMRRLLRELPTALSKLQ